MSRLDEIDDFQLLVTGLWLCSLWDARMEGRGALVERRAAGFMGPLSIPISSGS